MNRRRFLKLGVAGAAASAVLPGRAGRAWAAEEALSYGLLVDLTRCMGCQACEVFCADTHSLPRPPVTPGGDLAPQRPSGAFCPTTVDQFVVIQRLHDGRGGSVWARKSCAHCLEPACAPACPTGALTQSAAGPVTQQPGRCRGCHRCTMACPLGVPRVSHGAEGPLVSKCDLCAARLSQGSVPACAEVCPEGATTFGTRGALLDEARRRMAADPERYHGHIFGRRELGGLGVLVLSGVSFDTLGFPRDLGTEPAGFDGAMSWLGELPWLAGATLLPLLGVDRALPRPRGLDASDEQPSRRGRCSRLRNPPQTQPMVAAATGLVVTVLAALLLFFDPAPSTSHTLPWSSWSSAWLTTSAAFAAGSLAVLLTACVTGLVTPRLQRAATSTGLTALLALSLQPLLTPGAPWRTVDPLLGLPGAWLAGLLAAALLASTQKWAPRVQRTGRRRWFVAAIAALALAPALLLLTGLTQLLALRPCGACALPLVPGIAELTVAAGVAGLALPLRRSLVAELEHDARARARALPLVKATAAGLLALLLLLGRGLVDGSVAGGFGGWIATVGLAAAILLPGALLVLGGLLRRWAWMRVGAGMTFFAAAATCAAPWLTALTWPNLAELLGTIVAALAALATAWALRAPASQPEEGP